MTQLLLKGSAPYLHTLKKLGTNELDYIMLNFPFSCNYSCIKCCNRLRPYNKWTFNVAKIKKLIWKCKILGARVLVLAGEGETTMHKDFKEIISFAHKNGIIPYIFTNGSMLNKEMSTFLAENDATLIINIDSFLPERYDFYVKKEWAFKNLMKNLEITRNIYKKKLHALWKKTITSLAVNLVLNNENDNQIQQIKKFCDGDMIFVVNKPINIWAASQSRKDYDNVLEKLDKDISFPLGTLAEWQQCAYMRNGISISSNGEILTCAYALETQNLYGNIDDDILSMRKKVMKSVDDFYKKHGESRCILRHPEYKKFLKK